MSIQMRWLRRPTDVHGGGYSEPPRLQWREVQQLQQHAWDARFFVIQDWTDVPIVDGDPDGDLEEHTMTEKRPVWLRTEGTHVVVLVQEGDGWKEIIRETRDAEISHIWEDPTGSTSW